VAARQGPPIATAISFIDCINRRDVDGLGGLMTEDHQLEVFDEPPLSGRRETIEAWSGYIRSFPDYVIYPHRVAQSEHGVAVLGHTTGSHLGLSDEEEQELNLIWIAEIRDGRVRVWRVREDSPENRRATGLDQV
jgi:ketosteroid isomerase-like protein